MIQIWQRGFLHNRELEPYDIYKPSYQESKSMLCYYGVNNSLLVLISSFVLLRKLWWPRVLIPLFPSQYSRLVREALCELELPYVLYNIGEGSTRMKSLLNASGSNKVYFSSALYLYQNLHSFQSVIKKELKLLLLKTIYRFHSWLIQTRMSN